MTPRILQHPTNPRRLEPTKHCAWLPWPGKNYSLPEGVTGCATARSGGCREGVGLRCYGFGNREWRQERGWKRRLFLRGAGRRWRWVGRRECFPGHIGGMRGWAGADGERGSSGLVFFWGYGLMRARGALLSEHCSVGQKRCRRYSWRRCGGGASAFECWIAVPHGNVTGSMGAILTVNHIRRVEERNGRG